MNQTQKQRYLYWDNIKGILIFLVVLGHFLLGTCSSFRDRPRGAPASNRCPSAIRHDLPVLLRAVLRSRSSCPTGQSLSYCESDGACDHNHPLA